MTVCRYIVGDTREVVASLPAGSVDLVMTSPPFLALRSYLPEGHPDKWREIGSEPGPADFLDTLLDLTSEWRRVLTPHGSICVELGDTYSGSGGSGGDYAEGGLRDGQERFDGSAARDRWKMEPTGEYGRGKQVRAGGLNGEGWPLAKSLTMIPALYAASLVYGRNLLNPVHVLEPWRVRNWVAWVRPNPPVGALGDKVRPATSYLTWACRSDRRWFDLDAVRTPAKGGVLENRLASTAYAAPGQPPNQASHAVTEGGRINSNPAGAPPLDWWEISPGGYTGAHYAVYPEELCRIPIEASCPRRVCLTCGVPSRRITENTYRPHGDAARHNAEAKASADYAGQQRAQNAQGMANGRADKITTTTGWTTCGCPGTDGLQLSGFHEGSGWRPGVVLDPFGGSGTTGVVATGRGRDAILIELDERNADLAYERIGMFLEVSHFGAVVKESL